MLYLVGTPIGNIQDASFRAAQTLTNADTILVEDTRSFNGYYKKIQTLFNLKPAGTQKIIPYHKDNEYQQLMTVIAHLEQNKAVALVSESGMPTISDPGWLLLKQVIKQSLAYTVIPGPTAFVNALVLSGFPTDKVLFLGFLPKKKSRSLQLFNKLEWIVKKLGALTVIFYESPYRINETLKIINEVLPEAEICLCREMSKKFEEIIRGKTQDLMTKKIKGEITVVVKISKI